MLAILRENLIIPSPGSLRPRLLSLAIYRRRGRVPKGESRIVRFYINHPAYVALPRGLLSHVRSMVPTRVIDRRLLVPPVDFNWRGQLRPEQSQVAWQIYQAGGGIVVGLPGSGKTEVGMSLVAAFRQPALWLVHTKDLARQAIERAKSLFNLPPRAIGYVGEGEEDWGTHLTVAMVQTLAKKRFPQELQVGTVVQDEAHHAPALSMARVISRLPARYRIGLTATPERTDGLGPLMVALLGPAMATIDAKQLLSRGRILIPTVRVVETGFEYWGSGEWSALQRARAQDPHRNLLICSLVAQEFKSGRRILVLVELVDHARLLAAVLRKRYGIPAAAVVGEVTRHARSRAFKAAAEGRLVLVATKLADEGLDLPALDCLVLATPGRSVPRLQQQIGRVMRAFRGKEDAVVYDLADLRVESLRRQAKIRLLVYRRLGFRITDMAKSNLR